MISKIRVKEFLKQSDMRVSSDFYEALNEEIKSMLIRTAKRANGNRRSTVLACDV